MSNTAALLTAVGVGILIGWVLDFNGFSLF